MCGIAGIFSYASGEPVDHRLLKKMTDILAHRGPDGSGSYISTDKSAGLGHRRLSIIDLETGDQPMANEDSSVWVSFNGEIYNYRQLRYELRAKGHIFRTKSDTEVILHGYEEWGIDCATRFNGIFAFALWDDKKRSLVLMRDHFGVKPLYYCDSGGRFLFASEMKSILLDQSVSRELDVDALNLCLTFRYTPSPWTLLKSIRRIPPASYVIVNSSGVHTGVYSKSQTCIDRSKSEDAWVEQLSALYPQAIHRQMVSDVPIGLSLSSGVDSNTLLVLMSRFNNGVHTFTVGFEGGDAKDQEIDAAARAAAELEADSTAQVITEEDYASFMESYLWHLEEPIGNESAAAYHFVAKLAQPEVKVLLSGQGADEPFAGYPRHLAARYAPIYSWIPKKLVRAVEVGAAPLWRGREAPRRVLDALLQRSEVDLMLSIYGITTSRDRHRIFQPECYQCIDPELPRDYLRQQLASAPEGTFLERMLYLDARTSLPDNLLLCGDKMAMAAGVEMRVPFLDLELMETAERIPGEMKIAGLQNKAIHKKVCEQWLPKTRVHGRKIGFNSPIEKWLKRRLHVLLNDLAGSKSSLTRDVINRDYVRALQLHHTAGKQDYHRLLYLLLSLEMWKKVFVP